MDTTLKRISQVFKSAEQIPFDDCSNIVLMSDCHRGDGSQGDSFYKNKNIYLTALNHYYKRNYTYIEIGDGDELWENNNFSDILLIHKDVFLLLYKFYNKNRLYFIFGNHDIIKKDKKFVKNNLFPLFKNIKIHEGLILKHRVTHDKILLIHGHQGDFLNDKMWRLSKLLVRHLWRPLQSFGVTDPTSTSANYDKKEVLKRRLAEWVTKENYMLIAGHTHKPVFPEIGEPPYFNDGCCVYPEGITAIEIKQGEIMLVKWSSKTNKNGTLTIEREIMAGPKKIKDYFTID
jgi:UDP-2,3-diacylglucosamine pyrophosphatase LpxH